MIYIGSEFNGEKVKDKSWGVFKIFPIAVTCRAWKSIHSQNIVCVFNRAGGEQVEKLCSLDGTSGGDSQIPGSPVPGLGSQVWSVMWAPEHDSHLVTLVDNHLYYWDIEAAGKSAKVRK